MKLPAAATIILISVAAAQDGPPLPRLPKTTTATTPYGTIGFEAIELITDTDAPSCFFNSHIINPTGIVWDDVTFTVVISGLTLEGQRESFVIAGSADWIGNDLNNWYRVGGPCPVSLPNIAPDRIQI